MIHDLEWPVFIHILGNVDDHGDNVSVASRNIKIYMKGPERVDRILPVDMGPHPRASSIPPDSIKDIVFT